MNTAVRSIVPLTAPSPEALDAALGPAIFRTPRIHAVAVNATEMLEANSQIAEFLAAKIAGLEVELADACEASSIAETNGWKTASFRSLELRTRNQLLYYSKLQAAVQAGYTLVPNMPCDQFAIRVKRRRPAVGAVHDQSGPNSHLWLSSVPNEKEQVLPAGEGRYESPSQLIATDRAEEKLADGKIVKHVTRTPTAFDAIEFPFAAAAPVVMTATQAAMALKLFDRIGIVPQSLQRTEDPIVLGQIVMRANHRERVTSFLIAWHLDLRTL